ncbi:hypothetical protein OIU76_012385 [Salix suchowensis]|nr:hypothetical protein OIU76_012385 [Salix suchowensis]
MKNSQSKDPYKACYWTLLKSKQRSTKGPYVDPLKRGRFLRIWNCNRHKKFSVFDIERNRLFFASSNGKSKGFLLPSEMNQIELEDGDLITAFDFLMEKESLIIGTQNGLLLLHNVDDNSTEIVGQDEGGVKCISPSPDGDLLAILTGFRQVLVITGICCMK